MSREKEYTVFENVSVSHETAKALLVVIDGTEHWIPKVVIGEDSEVYEAGTSGDLHVETRFAEKEGLEAE